jgi:hypothetical protein
MTVDEDVESLLRIALWEEAHQAPIVTPEWPGPLDARYDSPHAPTRDRRGLLVAAAVCAAVAIAAAVGGGRSHRPPPDPSGMFPSRRTPAQTPLGVLVIKPGSLAAISVDGHPPLVAYTTVEYWGSGRVVPIRCVDENGSGACGVTDGATPFVSATSSVDNGVADYDLWIWANVPTGAAYVEYQDGDHRMTQIPIDGLVAFPKGSGSNEHAAAYDGAGRKIGDASTAAVNPDAAAAPYGPSTNDVTPSQRDQLEQLASDTIGACLHDAGLTDSAPAGTQTDTVWTNCVTQANTVVQRRFHEFG